MSHSIYALPIVTAVEGSRAGDVSNEDLMRAILAHPSWRVAARQVASGELEIGVLTRENGGRIVEAFSDHAALLAFETGEEPGMTRHLVELPGFMLFSRLSWQIVDRVNLDPMTDHAFHYHGAQIDVLNRWARTVATEVALYDPDLLPDPVRTLGRYDSYRVVLSGQSDAQALVLAPDEHDRQLLAAFTAEDVAEEFIANLGLQTDQPMRVVTYTGRQLFELLRDGDFDAVVFNPLTHLPARGLAAAIAPQVLATLPTH